MNAIAPVSSLSSIKATHAGNPYNHRPLVNIYKLSRIIFGSFFKNKNALLFCFGFMGCSFCQHCFSQCPQKKDVWNSIINIENNNIPNEQKIQQLYLLKSKYENCQYAQDSVYARLLHRISNLKSKINNLGVTNEELNLLRQAIRINSSGKKDAAPYFAVASYRNLGIYYESLDMNRQALAIYDSVIFLSSHFNDTLNHHLRARFGKVQIFYKTGDYQKCIEESSIGVNEAMKNNDSEMLYSFKNQRAQAYYYQSQYGQAIEDVNFAFENASKNSDFFEMATALKTKALLYSKENKNNIAKTLFEQGIAARIKADDNGQIADDYTDFGNFYFHDVHNYQQAKKCYLQSIEYAKAEQDFRRLAKAHVNLGFISSLQGNYDEATRYYLLALRDLKVTVAAVPSLFDNPLAGKLNLIGSKDLIHVILDNKTELLLNLYKKTREKKYLTACLQTAMLTDSVITQTRYEQAAEQSKLYWRKRTREFFTNAIEASYLANNAASAFYFMEKSKAVLLNDKLNELSASAYLPARESNNEQRLHIRIMEEQQKLYALNDSSKEYKTQLGKVAEARAALDNCIQSLEQKYPGYYQYKYNDKIPAFDSLKSYLVAGNRSFIHYFLGDTVSYILCVTPLKTKFIRLSKTEFNVGDLLLFLQYCANKNKLNSNYASFISISNKLFGTLFGPLQVLPGRVVICPDNFLIPFEAFCTDTTGTSFLINKYAISYVYSANYLMKNFEVAAAKGDFIGFAPVKFQSNLNMNGLIRSSASMEVCSKYYRQPALFLNTDASRSNFMRSIAGYKIVNIFSHASADTTDKEPSLYMQDSIIRLSELEVLHNSATRLVVLGACETNVGKNAQGEGIYSLARGFAAVGIPSIAATLWAADEQPVYAITEKFHEYISKGMQKDVALQKAKLFYMQNGGAGNQLPYYWANLVITGNTDPIIFSGNVVVSKTQSGKWKFITASIIIALILISFVLFKKKNGLKNNG